MEKVIATGVQDFEKLRVNQRFYIDKTDFIARWWNGGDDRVFEFFCTGAFFHIELMTICFGLCSVHLSEAVIFFAKIPDSDLTDIKRLSRHEFALKSLN